MSGPTWKRPKTPAPIDRDVYVEKHDAAPEAIWDEPGTGTVSGDDLRLVRSKRPTDKRLEKLEDKHDKLDEKVDAIDSRTSRIEGKLDTALAFIADGGKTKRLSISTNGKIAIGVVSAVSAIAIAAIKVLA